MQLKPTMLNERITTLDIIRGFSLLGILLVNIFAFYLPMPHIQLQDWFTSAVDIIWHQTLDIYVQGSFYPLFSILFGYGLAMQFMKAKVLNRNFYRFAPKRILAIFILGILHAFLLWWGDILIMYAFCALFVIAVIRFSPMILLILGIGINLCIHLLMIVAYSAEGIIHQVIESKALDIMMLEKAITAYGTGNWFDAFNQRLQDLSLQMGLGMWLSALFIILPFMLIGAALAKWKVVERAKDLKKLWISFAIVFTSVGLFIKSAPYTFDNTYLLSYLKTYVGGPVLAFGYIAIIVVICYLPFAMKMLSPIAKVGRMSLTLYLMQSIICTLIFYNYGFGLYGKIDVPTAVFIVFGIYFIQVVFAEIWFSKLKQGPIEWIVKKFTYTKILSEK